MHAQTCGERFCVKMEGKGGQVRWLPVVRSRGGRRWLCLAALTKSTRANELSWGRAVVWWLSPGAVVWQGVAYSHGGTVMASGRVLAGVPWHCSGKGGLGCEQRGRRDGANPSAPSTVATSWLGARNTARQHGPSLGFSPLSALTCHLTPSHSSTSQEHPRHKAESRHMGEWSGHDPSPKNI